MTPEPPAPSPAPDEPRPPGPWWLRRLDQAAVATLIAAALAATVAWWGVHGGWQGRLIEIERSAPQKADFQVDLNTATWPELAHLPGVGQSLARRIVDYRDAHGPFSTHDALRQVKGIGPKTLETIRPYLCPIADRPVK